MIKYNNILVLENDTNIVPGHLSYVLRKEKNPIEYWYDFSMSFHWDKEKAFGRLMNLSDDTLLVSAPSFVGIGNGFEGYLSLFLKLKDMGKKINIAIIYPENFYVYLLKFATNHHHNSLKRQNVLAQLKEVLDFHSVYEINYHIYELNSIESNVHITFDYLMENYFETNKNLGRTKAMIKDTSEIFEVYNIYYNEILEQTELVLNIEDKPNNKYLLTQIKKV